MVEYLNGVQLKELIDQKKISREEIGKIMGEIVGKVHARHGSSNHFSPSRSIWSEGFGSRIRDLRGICHGDLTTSNFMKSESKYYIIDFGLSQMTDTDENRAVGSGYDFKVSTRNSCYESHNKYFQLYRELLGFCETVRLPNYAFFSLINILYLRTSLRTTLFKC